MRFFKWQRCGHRAHGRERWASRTSAPIVARRRASTEGRGDLSAGSVPVMVRRLEMRV